jgi:pimeloyl-ACP methyl ester carboxylesterase
LDVALKLSFARRAALFVVALAVVPLLHAQAPKPLLVGPGVLPPTKTALVFGQKIVYYEVGTGPTLVLVHGFGSSAMFDFGNVIMPLAKTHHVIALDQIGWGASDKPYIDYRIQTFVDFLGEFLRVKNVEKFDLVGESLGGWIAAAYSIQALDPANTGKYALPRPSKLVLEDAAGHKAIHSEGPIPLSAAVADAAGVGVILYDKSRVTPEFVRQNFAIKLKANDGTTQRLLRANPKLESETVGDKLDKITIPTLVVWGGNDAVVPLADGKDYAAKIPNAKLVIVPECGHVSSMEKPDDFLAAVVPFLK